MNKHTTIRVSLVVAIAFFMQFLDTTAVNTAIPAMADAFGTDVVHLSTGVTSYLMALAIFIPVSGWIADRFGTRKVFCGAIAFFILSSTLCGTSQNLFQFVLYRIMQGMAGAMMSPVGRLAVLKVTPKDELPAAMNYITVPALVAPIVGPLVGGYLTTFWSWRWIFYLNVPISIVCILLAWHYIPQEGLHAGKAAVKKPFDWTGFVLSGLALAGFMYGVEMFSKTNVSYGVSLAVVIGSLAVLVLNVWHAKRTVAPLIDYSVMKVRTYSITIWVGSVSRIVIGAFPYLVPLMFQEGFGLTPFQSGLLFLSTMAGNLSMKSATVWIIRRFKFRNILLVNGFLVALFTFFTALLLPDTPVWIIVVTLFCSGLVRSMQFSSLTTLAFADIAERKMTAANTLYSTIQQMSTGMGIAAGAVALRFANMIHGGVPGRYTVPDFRLAFLFIVVIGFLHLFGYGFLKPTAGDAVRIKRGV
ncbi:DHA2 family efflux MFS transporter permease subunit [uncultured Rikenella sp.]|uniref:DHA2 family efflux MFS transporter permease subunit n=1 Tax=uncultured Rikenella sp. TaxID=368003 RepID=UPI00261E885A|nr:DHA2 family efflux MFS transporter permease subunit [uncultured Rikenella sp.]